MKWNNGLETDKKIGASRKQLGIKGFMFILSVYLRLNLLITIVEIYRKKWVGGEPF